jgi:hypothetical protein
MPTPHVVLRPADEPDAGGNFQVVNRCHNSLIIVSVRPNLLFEPPKHLFRLYFSRAHAVTSPTACCQSPIHRLPWQQPPANFISIGSKWK